MRRFAALGAVSLLAACGNCSLPKPPECRCDDGTRCREGESCPVPCLAECPTGLTCRDAACVPELCEGVVCPDGQLCGSTGACLPTVCLGVQCPAGEVCLQNRCEPPLCASASCSAGERCTSVGQCLPTACGETQCGPGLVCAGAQCVPAACVGVACPEGRSCAGGACLTTSCHGSPCPPGLVCDGQGACVAPVCVGIGCASGMVCAGAKCVAKDCPGSPCGPGEYCSGTECVSVLCGGVSCNSGTCVGGTCQPDPCAGAPCQDGGVDGGGADGGNDDGGSVDSGVVVDSGVFLCGDAGPELPSCVGSWCWEYPSPYGLRVGPFAGNAAVGLYSFGEPVLHWNGATWRALPDGTADSQKSATLAGSDFWLSGNNGVVKLWNGSEFRSMPATSPDSVPLHGLWYGSATDVWASSNSRMFHWDGGAWSSTLIGLGGNSLYDVEGSPSGEVWVVGGLFTYGYLDGGSWELKGSSQGSGAFRALWISPGGDVWAVGDNGTIAKLGRDPQLGAVVERVWVGQPTPEDLRDVWGDSPSSIWAVGDNGTIVHWDGAQWVLACAPTGADLVEVFGLGPSDVWARSANHGLVHWDGLAWSLYRKPATTPLPSSGVQALSGAPGGEPLALVSPGHMQRDAGVWMAKAGRARARTPVMAVQVDGLEGSGRVMGENGATFVCNSSACYTEGRMALATVNDFYQSIWIAPGAVLVGEQGLALYSDGVNGWLPYKHDAGPVSFDAVIDHGFNAWVSGHNDAGGFLMVGDYFTRTLAPYDAGPIGRVHDFWASHMDDMWAVGELGTVLHGDRYGWTAVDAGVQLALYGVAGASASDVWAVGDLEVILHWNGTDWTIENGPVPATAPRPALRAIHAQDFGPLGGGLEAYAVGASGRVLKRVGTNWTAESFPATEDLGAVFVGNSNLDVVGAEGSFWSRFRAGGAWAKAEKRLPPANDLWAASPNDVWAVGPLGAQGHWNGSEWDVRYSEFTDKNLMAVSGASANCVWAVGEGGVALGYGGTKWIYGNTGTTEDFSAVQSLAGACRGLVGGDGGTGGAVMLSGFTFPIASPSVAPIYGMYAVSATDVWAVGAGGTVLRLAGPQWTSGPGGRTETLTRVWGSASDNVYVLDTGGAIHHWNGSGWNSQAVYPGLVDLWGSGPSDVWVAGAGGILKLKP